MGISDEAIEQYWADGATVLRDVISEAWRDRLAAAIERGDRLDSEQCPLVYSKS